MPVRVVADSNVLISALYRGGTPGLVVSLAHRGEIELYFSPFIMEEVRGVLRVKLRWEPEAVEHALAGIPGHIVDPGPPRLRILKDDADNRILECAVAARAEAIVTGDVELRRIAFFEGVRVVTPREFVESHRAPRARRRPPRG